LKGGESMIVTVEELRTVAGYEDMTDAQLKRKIEAVENAICRVTHNNFIDRLTKQKAYPPDVVEGAFEMLKYNVSGTRERGGAGIASEALSRHSVSYVAQDGNNTIGGYPAALMGFLKPYYKARF
jgi:hypothetical protein